ncbi:response regulator [Clostridium sp. YIM B02505]|uniref:Stage 0 sporulation protein A homolog n=1 Tax=Clostridium yunnanense TaxID=2800325 RepID=A0ABS1EUI2_9CLOT|nr:response regulator [Clostridium yunnanense]MBK1813038.1 response regulator [Clostridium yunnanense]
MVKLRKSKIKILGIIIVAIIFALIINSHIYSPEKPQVVGGKIDLSNWNFNKDGVIKLDGQWQLYPNELLAPVDFRVNDDKVKENLKYIEVPSLWRKNDNIVNKGAATYRLLIKTNEKDNLLGINVENIKMASKVYINGKLLGQKGDLSLDVNKYKGNNSPYNIFFYNDSEKDKLRSYGADSDFDIEIIIQVANHDSSVGGIANSIVFGESGQVDRLGDIKNALDISASVVLILFGLYHLTIYKMGGKLVNKSFLHSGLFFMALAICILANGERILMQLLYNGLGYIVYRIQYFFSIGVVIPFSLFVRSINEAYINNKFNKIIYIVVIPYLTLILIAPFNIYSSIKFGFLAFNQVVILLVLVNSIRCIYMKDYGTLDKKGSIMFSAAMLCLFIFPIVTVIYDNAIFGSYIVLGIFFLGFIIFTATLLAYRFTLAYEDVAKLSRDLMEVEKATDEFMARISHDLKTPIFGISNISHSLLQREDVKRLAKERRDILLINRVSRRMSKLVGDISDFIILKSGRLRLELGKVDLKICVSISIDVFNYLIDKNKIELINEIKDNVFIYADEDRVRQILNNLVESSINNIEQGSIKISSDNEKNLVRIYIEYEASVVNKSNTQNIFNDKISPEHEELHFLIAKQLAEAMNGALRKQETEESGKVRFIFDIPRYMEMDKSNKPNKVLTSKPSLNEDFSDANLRIDIKEGRDFTILIVDDDVENIYVLANICASEGYDVLTALSAEEAIRKLRDNDVDVAIIETMLPKVSGIELCKQLRKDYNLVELPMLITTSSHKSDDLLLGLEAGANDYISKPFNDKEIKARIRTLINMKKSVREAVSSEMAFLHAQIKPHFLFNALSTIMSFCYTDGEKAANLIGQFSKYLRTIFDIDEDSFLTTIYNELDLVGAYLAIEKARFGDKISVEYDIDERLASCLIPSLIIQPLVENSIKHGIYDKETGVKIQVSVKESQEKVVIIVADDGIGMSKDKIEQLTSRNGNQRVGIRNVYGRVKSIKGSEFIIESEEQIFTNVIIKLPKM